MDCKCQQVRLGILNLSLRVLDIGWLFSYLKYTKELINFMRSEFAKTEMWPSMVFKCQIFFFRINGKKKKGI